jgi:hypothetical protein
MKDDTNTVVVKCVSIYDAIDDAEAQDEENRKPEIEEEKRSMHILE